MIAIKPKPGRKEFIQLIKKAYTEVKPLSKHDGILSFSYDKHLSQEITVQIRHDMFFDLFSPSEINSTVLRWDRDKGFIYRLTSKIEEVIVSCVLTEEVYKNYMATLQQESNKSPAAKETA